MNILSLYRDARPATLDGPADTVLPRLLATGAAGRAVWALYAFLPLLFSAMNRSYGYGGKNG